MADNVEFTRTISADVMQWNEWLYRLRQYVDRKGHLNLPREYVTADGYCLGEWVAKQRLAYRKKRLSVEQQTSLEQLPGWICADDCVFGPDALRWNEWLDRLQQYADREGNANVPSMYVTVDGYRLGAWVASQRSAYRNGNISAERRKALKKLQGWIWEDKRGHKSDAVVWYEWIDRLQEYIDREDHANVPSKYVTVDGYRLGAWVASQRSAYRNGSISAERRKALKQLHGWTWSDKHRREPNVARWNEWLYRLRQFANREGHANVPRNFVTDDGYRLGEWVGNQRVAYRKKKLSFEYRTLLEELPGWMWNARKPNTCWSERFKYLSAYVKLNKNAFVPCNYVTINGFKLGWWVGQQRSIYKLGKLSLKQTKKLEQIPTWAWDMNERMWLKGFEHLSEYVCREGHALVPRNFVEKDGYKLGVWVMLQRQEYRKKRVTKKRQAALEHIEGWMWKPPHAGRMTILKKQPEKEGDGVVFITGWHRSLDRLREYVKREGHATVPATHITNDGYKLGTWVRDQRYEYKKGRLSKAKQSALEELPRWVWHVEKVSRYITDTRWLKSYEQLLGYVEVTGNARVTCNYISDTDFRLGLWVCTQRVLFRQSKLSSIRRQLLEELPGWSWNPRKDVNSISNRWLNCFEHLRKYVELKGTARVPCNYISDDRFRLGLWVSNQRSLHIRGNLSADRQKMLEELPDWTWHARKSAKV